MIIPNNIIIKIVPSLVKSIFVKYPIRANIKNKIEVTRNTNIIDSSLYTIKIEEKVNPVKNVPLQKSWEYYMRTDIVKLMCCDSIYMLKGWRSSKGARLERYIARKLGFGVIYEH